MLSINIPLSIKLTLKRFILDVFFQFYRNNFIFYEMGNCWRYILKRKSISIKQANSKTHELMLYGTFQLT